MDGSHEPSDPKIGAEAPATWQARARCGHNRDPTAIAVVCAISLSADSGLRFARLPCASALICWVHRTFLVTRASEQKKQVRIAMRPFRLASKVLLSTANYEQLVQTGS